MEFIYNFKKYLTNFVYCCDFTAELIKDPIKNTHVRCFKMRSL